MKHVRHLMIAILSTTISTLAVAQAAGAGADFNKKEREQIARQKKEAQPKTYTEAEIKAMQPKEPTGKVTDVRRVGTPNGSTRDRPAKK